MEIIGIIIFIVAASMIIFTIVFMLSPKLQGKWMSRQIKSLKHMTNYSKEDLENIISNMGDISVKSTNNIIENNEDKLTNIVEKASDLGSIAVEKTARAIKNGLTEKGVYCKHCGKTIDTDSMFCKHCGKEV